MCGICGFNWQDEELIRRMNDQLVHRGPDQDGVFCADQVSLGHRRLSIIDLSEQGRQPMFNEDKSICLVFNGEIYNFQELRETLVGKGHTFRSHSDSEVIIHAYEEYGMEVLDKLRGMFAFALYDLREKTLFMARDRIGIKPLYYYHKDKKLVFASEIKAILEDTSIERKLAHQALYDYIGFEFVPAPATMFQDIYKLPAGHYLICCEGQIEVKQYWDLNFAKSEVALSYDQSVEKLRDLLD
jgi:asparagine synthase (glutamine-hydrolysing)